MISSSPPTSRSTRLIYLSLYLSSCVTNIEGFSMSIPASNPSPREDPSPQRRASRAAVASTIFRGTMNSRQQIHTGKDGQSDDFALRMGAAIQSANDEDQIDDCSDNDIDDESIQQQQIYERRHFLHGMLAAGIATAISTTIEPANAYEQAYPLELKATPYNEVETSSNSLSKLKQERISQKKAMVAATQDEMKNDPLGLKLIPGSSNYGLTIFGASTWALALWFASGSRSSPVVTPIANLLYDESKEDWLADRNDGYFGDLPLSFMAILSAVFVFCGIIADRLVYFLADGDAEVSLQLAGVSVIGGAVWEVGRLATKEKKQTRQEYERDVILYQEFEDFANKRIIVGRGSCHRSDVISAFRRYNPKYRTAESEQYPLSDIELERILKAWNREFGSRSEMSSAGFFSGIYVDAEADVFAPR